MYHGTSAEFDEFDKGKQGKNWQESEGGFFFTNSEKSAGNYAKLDAMATGGKERVIAAQLDIKKPLITEKYEDAFDFYDLHSSELLQDAGLNGNDGIIVKSIDGKKDLYVAFESDQVKPNIRVVNSNTTFKGKPQLLGQELKPLQPTIKAKPIEQTEQPTMPLQAPILPVQTSKAVLGSELPKEQMFAKKAELNESLKKAREIAYPKVKAKLDELGVPLNSDGSVTLYHGTSLENAKVIDKDGFSGMTWFSTNKGMPEQYGTDRGNDSGKVYEVKVNPSDLDLAGGKSYNDSFFVSLDKLKPNSKGIYSATGEDLRLRHKKYFEKPLTAELPIKETKPLNTLPKKPKFDINTGLPLNNDNGEIAEVLTSSKQAQSTLKERVSDFGGELKRKFIDAGDTVSKIGKITKDKGLYHYYNNARQSRRRAEYMVGEAQTNLNGKTVGKSIKDIFTPIRNKGEDYYKAFTTYMLHEHNIDRMAQNKPVFGESVSAEMSRIEADKLLKQYPEFANFAQEIYNYNKNQMQYRIDSGLVSQEQAQIWEEMYPHYVPTFRANPKSKGIMTSKNMAAIEKTVKTAKGSNLPILPLHENMAKQTMQTVEAANKKHIRQ